MKRILIADASKASLVMTSEVFKDHFPGVQVVVARNSADAIELAKSAGELDAFIIDYDLPDRDGAYTAARLKKMFSQPILITAFDRPDVQESIDRDLSAFDDCLSWLKKPVKPELVVSLAQRFIEGKHRCQRRLSCSIPAFLEVEFSAAEVAAMLARNSAVKTVQVAKAKVKVVTKPAAKGKGAATGKVSGKPAKSASHSTTKKSAVKPAVKTTGKVTPKVIAKPAAKATAAKAVAKPAASKSSVAATAKNSAAAQKAKTPARKEATVQVQAVRKIIPVLIDDVSLGGAKLRIHNQDLTLLPKAKGKDGGAILDFREGQILQIHVPPSHLVEAGSEALEKWQKTQAKELSAQLASRTAGEGTKSKKSSTLNPLADRTRSSLTSTSDNGVAAENQIKVLKGVVRWVASSEVFTFCGLRSETVNVSKRLFESMIEIESRSRNHLSPIVSPNSARGSKLNA